MRKRRIINNAVNEYAINYTNIIYKGKKCIEFIIRFDYKSKYNDYFYYHYKKDKRSILRISIKLFEYYNRNLSYDQILSLNNILKSIYYKNPIEYALLYQMMIIDFGEVKGKYQLYLDSNLQDKDKFDLYEKRIFDDVCYPPFVKYNSDIYNHYIFYINDDIRNTLSFIEDL